MVDKFDQADEKPNSLSNKCLICFNVMPREVLEAHYHTCGGPVCEPLLLELIEYEKAYLNSNLLETMSKSY